ncbi:hypothetical protein D3C81_1950400 [compost metagenome]
MEIGQFRVRDFQSRLVAVLPVLQVRLPDAINHIDVIQRADDAFAEGQALLADFVGWQ